jgi:hypothetical protein
MTDSNYFVVNTDADGNRINDDGSLYVHDDDDELSEDESEEDSFSGAVSYSSATNALGESVAIPDRSHFPDGSRTWMYSPAGKPSDWPADYIDENLEQVMLLGWAVPNEQGNHWTESEAEAANAAYVEQMTAAYRVDPSVFEEMEGAESESFEQQYEQQPSTESAYEPEPSVVPPAPPQPPDAPGADYGWQRPADPNADAGGTGYGNVMDELRQRVPENDGQWSAERAAAAYGDTQFAEESGINAADQRAYEAATASVDADGRLTAEGLVDANEAALDASRVRLDAEAAPNRYQQTTDRDTSQYDQDRRDLDDASASLREQVTSNPGQFGVGLSFDAQDYAARSGQTLEPGTELNAEQLAWLEQVRAADAAETQRQSEEFASTPEGQRQQAEGEAAQARYQAQQERFEESRTRSEERQQGR